MCIQCRRPGQRVAEGVAVARRRGHRLQGQIKMESWNQLVVPPHIRIFHLVLSVQSHVKQILKSGLGEVEITFSYSRRGPGSNESIPESNLKVQPIIRSPHLVSSAASQTDHKTTSNLIYSHPYPVKSTIDRRLYLVAPVSYRINDWPSTSLGCCSIQSNQSLIGSSTRY